MLTVQTMISCVEAEVRNGSSQSRYQGNTTGAQKRDAAIGQANISQENMGQANASARCARWTAEAAVPT
jgi:hypothetical protein